MDRSDGVEEGLAGKKGDGEGKVFHRGAGLTFEKERLCLLYTSDAADE